MDLNKSNPKAEAEKAETAKIDPSDLELGPDAEWNRDETKKAIFSWPEEDESKGEETEKESAILSLSEAAKKIDPSDLSTFLDKLLLACVEDFVDLDWLILRLVRYYGIALSQVSFQSVLNMFEEYPLSKLIDVPLSLIPPPVYKISTDFIKNIALDTLTDFVRSASFLILTDRLPGVVFPNAEISKVATFLVLAMVLRIEPDALALILPELRETPTYQVQDKLPVLIWMMALAFQDDFPAALYSWARNLLPLLEEYYSSHSVDLILQFFEMMLSWYPDNRHVFLTEAVTQGERLIPPCSFEMLVRLTFPAPSARVEATERFEAIYPLLKEMALAPDDTTTSANALEQIFTFSLELAGGQGNPALANEATSIAISVLTQNVDCFKQWDVLYKEHLEASVALLKKLVDEWKDHSLKLSSSSTNTLTVENAVNSFRMKNEKAITEGVANLSLYKEADQLCKLISTSLSRGPGIAPLTAMVIAAAGPHFLKESSLL